MAGKLMAAVDIFNLHGVIKRSIQLLYTDR